MSKRVQGWLESGHTVKLYVLDCANCGVVYAVTADYEQRRRDDGKGFYCPNGHSQSWHETEEDRQRKRAEKAEAQRVATLDQLHATGADAERTRQALARDRHRIANGVCPCCNRSFENVRRHMATRHPEFDPGPDHIIKEFKCSCSRRFETLRGLRIHQARQRGANWLDPAEGRYWRHLTEVNA